VKTRWPSTVARPRLWSASRGDPRYRGRGFAIRLLRCSIAEFFDDSCPQLAASIAYHVLFSLFPLTMMVAGGASIVLNATGSRSAAVDAVVRNLPLSAHGAQQVKGLLVGATSNTAAVGLLGFVGVVYAATGMMAALRTALNHAWDVEEGRPFLKGKLVDLGLVILVASVGLGSLALTVAVGLFDEFSGLPGWAAGALRIGFPFVVVLGTVLFLYLFVPATHVRVAEVWPAAMLVAVLVVAAQNLFAIYLRNFGHYNAIYGSLGAVIALMFFVYLSAEFLLFGAEIASEWPRVRHVLERGDEEEGARTETRLKDAVVGLWVRRGKDEETVPNDAGRRQATARATGDREPGCGSRDSPEGG
jgi:membrane protein